MQDEVEAPQPLSELVRLLRASLGRRYGDPDGWAIDLMSENGPPGRKRRLLRARHAASGRSFAIKDNAAPAHNRRQYRALRRLHDATRDCVAPRYISEDGQFFVMNWLEAPLLQEQLAGPERLAYLRRAGAWLARLQSVTARIPLLTRKPYILRLRDRSDSAPLTAVQDRLEARMARVSRREGPIAMLHGDFHPGNVFVAEDRLLVFDANLDSDGSAFIDLTNFLLSLGHLRALAAAAEQPWPGDEEEDRMHFFEGFGAIRERDLALYDLIEDLTIFRRWRVHRDDDPWFDDQMRAQGLLEPAEARPRPGRMVVAAGGGTYWSNELGIPPRHGPMRRAATRLGLSM